MKQTKHSVLTRLLSVWVVLAMALSILPGGVLAADIWSDWQKEHIKPVNALGTTAEYHDTVASGTSGFTVKAKVVDHVASLEVTTNTGLAGSKLYAVVFPYAHFTDPQLSAFVTKLNEGTITGANAAGLTTTDYRYCVNKTFAAAGGTTTITGADWQYPSNSQQKLRPITVNNTDSGSISTSGDKGTEFYRTYAFAVMSATLGGNTASDYAYGTFIMDAEGNMLEDTYMIRYIKNQNNPKNVGSSTVSGTVKNQIVPWDNTTNLQSETYTRPGYEFKGWDIDANRANSWLLYPSPSATTSDILYDNYYKYLWKPWDTITDKTVTYAPGAAFDPKNPAGRGTEYGITNLYAVWYPKSVEFKDDGLPKVNMTVSGKTVTDVPMQTVTEAQVRKNITYTGTLTGTTDTNTTKTYAPYSSGTAVVDGQTVNLSGLNTYFDTGWKLESNGNNTNWKLTGTPKQYSEVPLYFLIQVTDVTNNTKDLLLLKVPRIKKAAQPVPTLDANTGLQSQVEPVTPETGEPYDDGQIFGFYSAGPKIGDDTGYLATNNDKTKGTYGTGTMTGYYESLGMVYEYRPKTIGGTDVDWTAEGYKDMPNGGWREVPFISGRYNAVDLTKITAAGAKNAKTLMYSTLANGNAGTKAFVADKTNDAAVNASSAFKENGWLDSYGWITFNDAGLPEIHGLTEDDVYEVRFRENANAAESDPQLIQIGGVAAAAAPGGGSGLLFNLMKGSVWAVTPGQEPPQETAVREVELTIGEHGTVTVENLTPAPAEEATQAEDEEEPVQPSYTNGTFKFTVTDPDKACTVTAEAEAGYTASAVIGGEAAEFTGSMLTLPQSSADGKLAVAVRFEPAAGGGEETEATLLAEQGGTERDVTAQLFGVSPTGALPSGAAANLTENEALELRDPSGEAVESVTFFTSATGTYIETYTCTLSEDKKSLIWTQGGAPVTEIALDGQSQGLAASWGGKADPTAFTSVVFYDWDETTVLGSTVLSKTATADEVKAAMTTFTNGLMKGGYDPATYDPNVANYDGTLIDEKPQYPLNAKKGYSFGKWIDFDSDDHTIYGKAVDLDNNYKVIDWPEPADYEAPADISSGIILKAAYTNNSDMASILTEEAVNTSRHYTVSVAENGRFGATPTYSVTVRVQRENNSIGVLRGREPALRVMMVTAQGEISLYSLVKLNATDDTTVEIVPNTNIKYLSATVIDVGGVSNWIDTTARSDSLTVEQTGDDGFVVLGNVSYINDELSTGTTSSVLATFYNDAGLNTNNPANFESGNAAAKRRQAWANMLTAWNEANPNYSAEKPYRALSKTELQTAIDTGHFTPDATLD